MTCRSQCKRFSGRPSRRPCSGTGAGTSDLRTLGPPAKDPFTRIYPVPAAEREHTSELVYGETVIMTLTDRDAQPTGLDRPDAAKAYAEKIQAALSKSREQNTVRALIVDSLLVLLDPAVFIGLLVFFQRVFPRITAKIYGWRGTVIRPLKLQRVEFLSANQIAAAPTGVGFGRQQRRRRRGPHLHAAVSSRRSGSDWGYLCAQDLSGSRLSSFPEK